MLGEISFEDGCLDGRPSPGFALGMFVTIMPPTSRVEKRAVSEPNVSMGRMIHSGQRIPSQSANTRRARWRVGWVDISSGGWRAPYARSRAHPSVENVGTKENYKGSRVMKSGSQSGPKERGPGHGRNMAFWNGTSAVNSPLNRIVFISLCICHTSRSGDVVTGEERECPPVVNLRGIELRAEIREHEGGESESYDEFREEIEIVDIPLDSADHEIAENAKDKHFHDAVERDEHERQEHESSGGELSAMICMVIIYEITSAGASCSCGWR